MRAIIPTINSVAFPNVTFSNPPSPWPILLLSSSVEKLINAASGIIAKKLVIKMMFGDQFSAPEMIAKGRNISRRLMYPLNKIVRIADSGSATAGCSSVGGAVPDPDARRGLVSASPRSFRSAVSLWCLAIGLGLSLVDILVLGGCETMAGLKFGFVVPLGRRTNHSSRICNEKGHHRLTATTPLPLQPSITLMLLTSFLQICSI